MNLLIIDDQTSVINGLETGINFQQLGIADVFTAANAAAARTLLMTHPIHIMLCDIEMPGESGLALNKWTADHYPDIVRILISSHAKFTYAQESLKLGCFDYIVQPAPYDEIEASLARAIEKLQSDSQNRRLYDYGKLYMDNKSELSESVIYNLYSENARNVENSLHLLNKMGYPLVQTSQIQHLVIDIYPHLAPSHPVPSAQTIMSVISVCLQHAGFESPVYSLLTQNKFKQYVCLLFCNDSTLENYTAELYECFYKNLEQHLRLPNACYVGLLHSFTQIRTSITQIHTFMDHNVTKKSGLFPIQINKFPNESLSFAEYANRWEMMLVNGQFDVLCSSILSYIDFIITADKASFKALCDLHQQLTYLFFNFAYEKNIDIMELFSEEWNYNNYMDSFKNVDMLKKSIRFITGAIESASQTSPYQNDVQKAKTYIIQNIAQNISVKDVAAYVHLSPEYFTKLFKKETGQNIKNYIMQAKIDVAKDLLLNPNIPVSLIALEIGYTNFSHFTQIFKKYEDLTPSEYRKKHLGQQDL